MKAVRRADDNRYLRKELARTKNERDRFKTDTKEYKAKLKQIEQQNKRPAVILIVQEFPFCFDRINWMNWIYQRFNFPLSIGVLSLAKRSRMALYATGCVIR